MTSFDGQAWARDAASVRRGGAALGLAVLIASCGRGGRSPALARSVLHVVTIKGIAFSPLVVHVAYGDTVEWRNLDLVPHTVTARDRRWDSGNVAPDSSWRLVVAGAGSMPYSCRYHTQMHGTLEVTAATRAPR